MTDETEMACRGKPRDDSTSDPRAEYRSAGSDVSYTSEKRQPEHSASRSWAMCHKTRGGGEALGRLAVDDSATDRQATRRIVNHMMAPGSTAVMGKCKSILD